MIFMFNKNDNVNHNKLLKIKLITPVHTVTLLYCVHDSTLH